MNHKDGYDLDTGPSKIGHWIIICTVAFLLVALLWASLATLDEVTVAVGKVIPSTHVQVIQNLEGGIVEKILIREGEVVKKGQILMLLDETQFASEYRGSVSLNLALKIKIRRLQAEAYEQPFQVPDELKKQVPQVVKSETAQFNSRQKEYAALLHQRELLNKEINMTAPLVKQGAVSEVELLRLQQKLSEFNHKINNMRSVALEELNKAKTELSGHKEKKLTLKDKLERTSIRSPVKGIVKQLHVTTVGGVIKPGMDLMEIVPLEDTLRIEAQVRPDDIGFIHPQQKAVVKITAYDFTIYGGLEGNVEHISADTTRDEEGQSFYEIWVRTDKNYLMGKKGKLTIIPGMQASVDILTGKKTVLEYLMKPIIRAKQSALRER